MSEKPKKIIGTDLPVKIEKEEEPKIIIQLELDESIVRAIALVTSTSIHDWIMETIERRLEED